MAVQQQGWIDRALRAVAPRWHLQRQRARLAGDLMQRHYEGAAHGRRTVGWKRTSGDAAASTGPYVGRLRDIARDLVRNNPYAESILTTIVNHAVGWGIVPKPKTNAAAAKTWADWASSTKCDADGRNDFYGLEKLVIRTVAESGEALVRRRLRRLVIDPVTGATVAENGLAIPLQLQVLEPDFIDTTKHQQLPNGGRIVYGVEFDAIGRRVAYWLFTEHPGNSMLPTVTSVRVPADGIIHVFKPTRPGSVRGASWFAPILLRLKDLDEFEDATLMKQKIAACLAALVTDTNGDAPPLGTADDSTSPGIDTLEPGGIHNLPPGSSVQVVNPPTVREYPDYVQTALRSVAAGMGVTYEDTTGDYTELPFSAARMSRLRHWANVDDWRWRMLVPQFCDQAWVWAMESAAIMGLPFDMAANWTAPPMPMLEPDKEGLAYQRNIRTGIQTLSDAIRERGYDPDTLLAEYAEDLKKLDKLGIWLDSDVRRTSQAGLTQERIGLQGGSANGEANERPDGDDGDSGNRSAGTGKPKRRGRAR